MVLLCPERCHRHIQGEKSLFLHWKKPRESFVALEPHCSSLCLCQQLQPAACLRTFLSNCGGRHNRRVWLGLLGRGREGQRGAERGREGSFPSRQEGLSAVLHLQTWTRELHGEEAAGQGNHHGIPREGQASVSPAAGGGSAGPYSPWI